MMNEIWKPVVGFEGYYEVSNMGRIKAVGKYKKNKSKLVWLEEKILKPFHQRDGYLLIDLNKDGVRKTCLVHRLVAAAFLDNPNKLPCVNHKNEVKDDNRLSNLELCDYSYNVRYSRNWEKAIPKNKERCSCAIEVYTKDGEYISSYNSIIDASIALNMNRTTISEALRLRDGRTKLYTFRRI